MKRAGFVPIALLAAALAFCSPAFAHHGASAYVNKVLVMKNATVTKFIWANPHVIVLFEVKADNGDVSQWAAEAGSPSAVSHVGWNRNSLQPGDVITVYLYPAKSGNPVGRLNKIVLADGKTLRDTQLGGNGSTEPSESAP
jgi:hypothetical protein